MRAIPELRATARRLPHRLQEFFTNDVTALVVGIACLVAGFFVRQLKELAEFKDGVGALCDAIVIAAILKLFVDPILKRELAQEAAKDVFHYAFGYTLPDKLKSFVQDLVLETRTVRHQCKLHWNISPKVSEDGRLELVLTTLFNAQNFTNKPSRYRHEVYAWKEDDRDVGCVRALFYNPNGSGNRAYRLEDKDGLKLDPDGFVRGDFVTLHPEAPREHNTFGAVYYAEADRKGIDQFSIRETTLDIEVSITVADDLEGLDFSVIPDPSSLSATDEYKTPTRNPSTKELQATWLLNKVFVANEKVVLRWKSRDVPTITYQEVG